MSTPLERLELLAGHSPGGVDPLTRAAFEAAADGLAVLDLSSDALIVVHANARLAESLEEPPQALPGRSLLDWTNAAGAAALRDLARLLHHALPTRPVALTLRTRGGATRRMRVTLRPLAIAEPGRLSLATFLDVAEAPAIDAVVETLPVELMEFDRDLVIRWANAAAIEATGRPREQVIGHRWTEVQPMAEERLEIYARVLAGEALDFECMPMTFGDAQRFYQTSLRPIRGPDGSVSGLIAMGRDVTDRERARRAVEEVQRRFAAMIASTNDVIAVIGSDGMILYESPSVERITGFRPEELVGLSLLDFLHPRDAADIRARLANVAAGGATSREAFTVRVRHRDGHYVWLESTTSNLLADPAVRGIVVVSRDITRRRAVEAALAEGRERLELALGGAAVGTWSYDVETGVHRFDHRCAAILGREAAEIVLDLPALADLTHPDDIVEAREALLRYLRGATSWYETEYRARHADGEWRWVAARGRSVERGADGRVRRIAGVLLDIDARKRAEAALRTQGRMLETLREGVLLVGADGLIRIANRTARRMFGVGERDTLEGRSVSDLGLDARRLARLAAGRGESVDSPIEWLARRDDGSTFLAETAVSELRDGAEASTIAVIMDVTERKRLERAIIDASSREQQRIGQDLHDGLGQELTGISLMLRSYARRMAMEDPKGVRLLEEVIELVNHAVESARALAHGLSPMILEHGGLPAALAHLAANATRTHGLRVRFRKSLADELRIDPTVACHLYRIAQEAVSNAARHSGASMVTVRLDVGSQSLRLSITDDGRGLPPVGERGGDGLGLRIMEYRARMIQARFRIEQPARGGTRISCRVPQP